MKVVIIGCGLIGKKRAAALTKSDHLAACCDTNQELADSFAKEYNCQSFYNINTLVDTIEFDIAIVAVINHFSSEIILKCLHKGKHVLAEKPLGKNVEQSSLLIRTLSNVREKFNQFIVLKTGFNHRHHPAILKAKEIIDSGSIGSILYIRGRYGHGGRPSMEKEWRSSKELCGGGELLDQGVHLIDLIRWFANDPIKSLYGTVKTKFWPIEVEDNAFVQMETKNGIDVQFHVSWTNWKNVFNFEIFGENGYLKIDGLGGSYGVECLEMGIRNPQGGAPKVEKFVFDEPDNSWHKEWIELLTSIAQEREPIGNGLDGHFANQVIEAIYKSNSEDKKKFL